MILKNITDASSRKRFFNRPPFIAYLFATLLLSACSPKVDNQFGQQYIDGTLDEVLNPVSMVRSKQPKDFSLFKAQQEAAAGNSVRIRNQFGTLYHQLNQWIASGSDLKTLSTLNIQIEQLGGGDHRGNVLFTSYYSPVIKVSHKKSDTYQYPLYALPNCPNKKCPDRSEIHEGALDNQGLELGYSSSLLDNFLLGVQGSGFVQYDDKELRYLSYAGKNNYPYTSIGRVLIDRGEVDKDKMSTGAIKEWVTQKDEATVKELLEQNRSFVFFKPHHDNIVRGGAGVPLLPLSSVAADRQYFEMGSVLLAEVPQLDSQGQWTGQHILKLLLVLDTGGAVKGNHFDLYQGIGDLAGEKAGAYRHFGRVWKLTPTNTTTNTTSTIAKTTHTSATTDQIN